LAPPPSDLQLGDQPSQPSSTHLEGVNEGTIQNQPVSGVSNPSQSAEGGDSQAPAAAKGPNMYSIQVSAR